MVGLEFVLRKLNIRVLLDFFDALILAVVRLEFSDVQGGGSVMSITDSVFQILSGPRAMLTSSSQGGQIMSLASQVFWQLVVGEETVSEPRPIASKPAVKSVATPSADI